MRRRWGVYLLAGGIMLMANYAAAETTVVGAIPGQFAVSETGAATYTIPIAVPPGIAGLEPKLALTYNSQGGNGLLGVGWSLSGLSAITRCPRTIAQDGANGGIEYSTSDKYCLDGQRLFATTSIYGANGTEYRTELESFTKIISYGTAGNGPAWFKVWTKSGQIVEYGNTADARIEAQGKTTAAVWAVNKISDTKGNYLTVTYTEDNANGQYYPSRIDYSGNANTNTTPTNSIQFVYETRPDTNPQYVGGSLVNLTKRVTTLQIYNASSLRREYRSAYENSAAPNNASRLVSLMECAGDGSCLPKTIFGWQLTSGQMGFASPTNWNTQFGANKVVSGDMNEDGRADIIYSSSGSPGYVYLQYSNGNGLAPPEMINDCSGVCPSIGVGDVNGDGKLDLIYGNGSVQFNTGTGMAAPVDWNVRTGINGFVVGDANGSGRSEIIHYEDGGGSYGRNTDSYSTYVTFLQTNSDAGYLSPQYAGGFPCAWSRGNCNRSGAYFVLSGDVDGDGRSDMLLSNGNIKLSQGDQFSSSRSGGVAYGSYAASAADVNGDGRTDVFYVIPTYNPTAYIFYSNGKSYSSAQGISGFPCQQVRTGKGSTCILAPAFVLADVDGDGHADLVIGDGTVRLATFSTPDLLTDITSGLGAHAHITYNKASYNAAYTPEAGSVFPIRDLLNTVSIYLVTETTSDDGAGHDVRQTYHYAGAKSHLQGRGFLGFREVRTTDAQTGLISATEYRQDYPYIGLPSRVTKTTSGGTLIYEQDTTYAAQALGGTRYFPYAAQSVESRYDLDGSLMASTTTTNQYDAYGNATQISVVSNDGHSKVTVNQYDNDVTNWILGRLRRAAVTSTTP